LTLERLIAFEDLPGPQAAEQFANDDANMQQYPVSLGAIQNRQLKKQEVGPQRARREAKSLSPGQIRDCHWGFARQRHQQPKSIKVPTGFYTEQSFIRDDASGIANYTSTRLVWIGCWR